LEIPATGVNIVGENGAYGAQVLTVGDTRRLTATLIPSNTTNQSLLWRTDSDAITIGYNNVGPLQCTITGNRAGTATVSATTSNGKIGFFTVKVPSATNDPDSTLNGAAGTVSFPSGLKDFVKEPLNATWGISKSTIEAWFIDKLKNRSNLQDFAKICGINSINIGQITATVNAAGVSPVFFYAYTVNEGGRKVNLALSTIQPIRSIRLPAHFQPRG